MNILFNKHKLPEDMEDITAKDLKKRLEQGEQLNVIDVREDWEYDEFNIGARLIPIGQLPERLEELSDLKDEELIIHCRSGARSGQAKMFLEQNGFNKVRNVLGGMIAFQES